MVTDFDQTSAGLLNVAVKRPLLGSTGISIVVVSRCSLLYVELEWCRRWYLLARVACRANKLIGVDTCLATFRGAIRTLNSTVSDPSGCLEGVAQFCVLWSAEGFPLSVRDPISSSGDPRPLTCIKLVLTRRRGAHAAHTQIGRPTHEAPTRENTRKHTQTRTNTQSTSYHGLRRSRPSPVIAEVATAVVVVVNLLETTTVPGQP